MSQEPLYLLPCLWGVAIACSPIANSNSTFWEKQNLPLSAIGELSREQNVGETVYLQGKVGTQVPLVNNSSVYQLEDSTGTIWVVTQQFLPDSGGQIVIKGQVEYESIPIAEQEQGEIYIQELEQLDYQPSLPSSDPSDN